MTTAPAWAPQHNCPVPHDRERKPHGVHLTRRMLFDPKRQTPRLGCRLARQGWWRYARRRNQHQMMSMSRVAAREDGKTKVPVGGASWMAAAHTSETDAKSATCPGKNHRNFPGCMQRQRQRLTHACSISGHQTRAYTGSHATVLRQPYMRIVPSARDQCSHRSRGHHPLPVSSSLEVCPPAVGPGCL